MTLRLYPLLLKKRGLGGMIILMRNPKRNTARLSTSNGINKTSHGFKLNWRNSKIRDKLWRWKEKIGHWRAGYKHLQGRGQSLFSSVSTFITVFSRIGVLILLIENKAQDWFGITIKISLWIALAVYYGQKVIEFFWAILDWKKLKWWQKENEWTVAKSVDPIHEKILHSLARIEQKLKKKKKRKKKKLKQ